jgi:hypothetical protein
MALSEEERERLADIVELQPTKNSDLQDRWGMDSGSEVHRYLEDHLKEYYYRDEKSLIRATAKAGELVDVEPGGDVDDESSAVRVPELQATIVDVAAGPDEDGDSVVAVLHKLRDAGTDTDVDAVRSGLWSLRDKGVVDVVQEVVPTFRLALPRDELNVEVVSEDRE